MRSLSLLLLLSTACVPTPDPAVVLDADGDGELSVADGGSDCDDLDDTVFPGAVELCNDRDDDCDGDIDEEVSGSWYADEDADGYGTGEAVVECERPLGHVAAAGDCDDADASIHPAAAERCDNVDNDCSGDVDDDAIDGWAWHPDADNDGYGSMAAVVYTCTGDAPDDHTADSSDCDDFAPAVNPAALDDCDGADTDCDGTVDDDPPIWFADSDTDGFGDASAPTAACTMPAGHSADDTDCNDGDDSIHPGAGELCNGVDEDCDGILDNDPTDGSTYWLDIDADGYGDAATSMAACVRPSTHAVNDTDCDDSDPGINPGATEICDDGIDQNCSSVWGPCAVDTAIDDITPALTGGNSEQGGRSLLPIDVDNDGVEELLVAFAGGPGAAARGHIEMWSGPFIDDQAIELVPTIDAVADSIQLGTTLVNMGDISGDGFDDIAVAAYASDVVVDNGGQVFVFDDVASGGTTDDARFVVEPSEADEYVGIWADGGVDLVGDDTNDLVVSSRTYQSDRGYVAIIDGTTTGSVQAIDATSLIYGNDALHESMGAVVDIGDYDNEGTPELAIAAYDGVVDTGTREGVVYILEPLASGTDDVSSRRATIEGLNDYDRFGGGMSDGDINNDGIDDLLVAAPYSDIAGQNAGSVYLFEGPISDGKHDPTDADATLHGVVVETLQPGFGYFMEAVGDLNGDGLVDVVVNQLQVQGPAGELNAGTCWVFYGPVAGTMHATDPGVGQVASNSVGSSPCWGMAGLQDQDGDGTNELAVGAPFYNGGSSKIGGVWFIAGGTE